MKNQTESNDNPSNFIRAIIEKNIRHKLYENKNWGGTPGDKNHHSKGKKDLAKIRTRFPPEPNGYLHIGHAKSIFLNFGLAKDFNGACHLRFDDTNPEKENDEFVNSIIEDVNWLGFDWQFNSESNLFYASDYFELMYTAAKLLIQTGHAYIDQQSADEIKKNRGTLTKPGINSPFRNLSPDENLRLFEEMKDTKHADGSMVLRAKIDMSSPNINLRDPAIYRIKRTTHHRTFNEWCIYPMYTFAHPIEDALEGITHSICTLEFEDQRPFYDWVLEKLLDNKLLSNPLPKQYEFARLNLTYVVLSKRCLVELVEKNYVSGWNDPRMPTLIGSRRRGYTPEGFKLFCERIGVSKADSWIDYSILEDCMREVLNISSHRRIAVLEPLKLVINNLPDDFEEECFVPNHPQNLELGKRTIKLTKELWIEKADFMEEPEKKYFRLFPGNQVRLRYGYVITCTGCEKDKDGNIIKVLCDYLPDTKSGTPGSDSVKVKGNIHWVSTKYALNAEVSLYDRLFKSEHPGLESENYLDDINPNSIKTVKIKLEENLANIKPYDQYQFERHGYFICDQESTSDFIKINRTVTLRDTWK
ncbi:glutamine--tRNA ligase/YqeY domain fusion protein [Methylophilaceae bacterium]|nr:glutamine--tRNA ligase/YqeY domain fusion protein [Methylophilaceae bacterium]|tara:strand:+ start:9313 stop:11073 length:1761 start_codon:yes stop_codon:yes gene_type:complete